MNILVVTKSSLQIVHNPIKIKDTCLETEIYIKGIQLRENGNYIRGLRELSSKCV